MNTDAQTLDRRLLSSATAAAEVAASLPRISEVDDTQLRSALDTVTALGRIVDLIAARLSGEVARRSTFDLGYSGLAQREGFRTPEALIQSRTGSSRSAVSTLVEMGALLGEIDDIEDLATTDPDTAHTLRTETAWKSTLATAILDGEVSLECADAIRRGIGTPDAGVTVRQVDVACVTLLEDATGVNTAGVRLNADELFVAARRYREEMDVLAIARREKQQADQEYLKAHRRSDGMVSIHGLLTPENGDFLLGVLDQGTNPRRGGPRMADPAQKAHAQRIIDDPRSNAQINVETLIVAVRAGVAADRTRLPGRAPAVRVVSTADTVAARTDTLRRVPASSDSPSDAAAPAPGSAAPAPGSAAIPSGTAASGTGPSGIASSGGVHSGAASPAPATSSPAPSSSRATAASATPSGSASATSAATTTITTTTTASPHAAIAHLEESGVPVTVQTLDRLICDGSTVDVYIAPDGQVVAFSTEQRLFTSRQRVALAVRDGGCRVQGCPRPPSWCEAHHVEWYKRDNGKTEIANGILLCRHHHMLIHNNGWEIVRDGGNYWLRPPASVDPARTLRPMPSKNPIITAIQSENGHREHPEDPA